MGATDRQALLQRFWQELGETRTGMLGIPSDDDYAQPMTAHFNGSAGPIWFYARRDSDIARSAEGGHPAQFHYASGGHDLYACVHGDLTAVEDTDAASRFWSDEVARWFPQGQDDPDLIMLRFEPSKAQIWLPQDGHAPTIFGFGDKRPEDVRAEVRV